MAGACHALVLAAWLHALGYLFWRLYLADLPPSGFSHLNVIVHGMTLILAGLASTSIFKRQNVQFWQSSNVRFWGSGMPGPALHGPAPIDWRLHGDHAGATGMAA